MPFQIRMRLRERLFTELAPFTREEAVRLLAAVCGGSVYAHVNELISGFVTLPGGVRVGIAGRPLPVNGTIVNFTQVTGFNIRIPREIKGCAERFIRMLTSADGMPVSAVIAAPPGVGKTTFLRDCIRCFSNGVGTARPLSTCVADERNELTGSVDGAASLDVGPRTDVLEGIPKSVAIPMLIRSMSPDVIVTDELMGKADIEAVSRAAKSGVAVLASTHSGSAEEIIKNSELSQLFHEGTVKKLLLLSRRPNGTAFALSEIPLC